MNRVCYVVAEHTAKACYATGLPGTTNEAAKEFLKGVCNAAGDRANQTCLSGEATRRFGALPTCDGLGAFIFFSIQDGGAKVLDAIGKTDPATDKKLADFVKALSKASAEAAYDKCVEVEKKRLEKVPAPQKPAKPLTDGFDV